MNVILLVVKLTFKYTVLIASEMGYGPKETVELCTTTFVKLGLNGV
ncbi:hypothetical protein Q2T41_00525 [Maribacter confluentis]|uniref:Uncharacterized protein n=1 Tax=Maribacter confluentis TaxID=1656093 RepID=A0ABT8RJB8_9FLAO|nr:hypothetical protein [Maribacter confluentis]MDO1511145.1 hypothetical protein [Maribacter confluentis]